MPFAAMWMQLEILILSEVSQKEKDIPYDITYIWNLIYGTNETFYRKENHGHGELTCVYQIGGGGSGMDREFRVSGVSRTLFLSDSSGSLACPLQILTLSLHNHVS